MSWEVVQSSEEAERGSSLAPGMITHRQGNELRVTSRWLTWLCGPWKWVVDQVCNVGVPDELGQGIWLLAPWHFRCSSGYFLGTCPGLGSLSLRSRHRYFQCSVGSCEVTPIFGAGAPKENQHSEEAIPAHGCPAFPHELTHPPP